MTVIDGYRVKERLGTSVFLVEHGRRRAALKLLGDDDTEPEAIARCFNAACAAAALRHPAIARVYDVGVASSGEPFIVSELLAGESLARRLARGPLPLQRALAIARQIARTLAAAHERSLAHGALEPDHIILVGDRVKLINFGVAHVWAGARGYASPEQCRATSTFDARSDLYALGCVLFEMIAGHPPFHSDDLDELRTSHLMARPPEPSAPAEVRDLVASLLEKNPADRPASALVVAALLDGLLRPVTAPKVVALRWLAAVVVTASLACTSAYTAGDQLGEKLQAVFHVFDQPSLPR